MRDQRIRHLVVIEHGRLVGVLSSRDFERHGDTIAERTVGELMTRSPASAMPRTTLRQAANLMRGGLIGSLPIVQDERVVGNRPKTS